jgi:P-type E1-E2 ATPase
MLTYDVPGLATMRLSTLVLDLNGTATVDGLVIPGLAEKLAELQAHGVTCYLLTADTRGTGAETAETLGVHLQRLAPGDEPAQKRAFVEGLGAGQVVAIGNGANDVEMLQAAALGIAVIQAEGAAAATLRSADVVVPGIREALDLLLKPSRLIATLRR